MTLTQLIAAHLAASVTSLAAVGDAADLAAIKRETMKYPSAYVVPLADKGGPNDLDTGLVEQRREPRIGVVMVVRNVRATKGATALSDVETLRQAIDDALLGWSPEAKYDPMLFASGKLLSMENGVMFWQDEYTTAYLRRSA